MRNPGKYGRVDFLPPEMTVQWVKKPYLDQPPIWCSVDLRDGNQALPIPMSTEEKLDYFHLLLNLGFQEIEVGFPAASNTEFSFVRLLIEEGHIPNGVAIQVFSQAREHIIQRTFEAVEGAKNVIFHLCSPTSPAHRDLVLHHSQEEVRRMATDGARMVAALAEGKPGFRFEYSPEAFTATEPDFALSVCNAVMEVWSASPEKPVILNLPVTVAHSLPHVFACQVEYMSTHLERREGIILSVHPHNDRGTAVAMTEMALLAGAQRVEGTLFGNGERTGNVDIVTLALNLYVHGVDPGLDFSHLPDVIAKAERLTGIRIPERLPYAGDLVFTAFSGSHQDAIAKAMKERQLNPDVSWNVPYLPIDPADIGREYESSVIRINSQSGKAGVGYIMERKFGFTLPPEMRNDFGSLIKLISDRDRREIQPTEMFELFRDAYLDIRKPLYIKEHHFSQREDIHALISGTYGEESFEWMGSGNGRLDAVSNTIMAHLGIEYTIKGYAEHALSSGSDAVAVAYVGIVNREEKVLWGAGTHTDIVTASVFALVSAINRLMAGCSETPSGV